MAHHHPTFDLRLSGLAASMILAVAGCNLQLEPMRRGAIEMLAPSALPVPQSTVAALEQAYDTRDHARFEALLAEGFLFIPDMSESWSRVEEVRIHRRMFEPAEVPPGNPPVPPELWLQDVDATLTQLTKFTERPDFYASPSNPAGLDPAKWYVSAATYSTHVFFQMQGETDFQVDGRAAFVVMVERDGLGTSRQSYLYRWEDLGSVAQKLQGMAIESTTWSDVKQLYR